MNRTGFRFGLEGEYLLVEADSFRPLWYTDLAFERLNAVLENIPWEPLLKSLPLDGLERDPPHRRIMPFYVEGYGMPDAELCKFVDLLPKGIEIRTPVCTTIEQCLEVYESLYLALQEALAEAGYRPVPLSHHPTAWTFKGPQNHRRNDWWYWGMQSMTTYGPDLNISLPDRLRRQFDWDRLQGHVNYYAAAMVAFSLASPVGMGQLWKPRGEQGFSLRTYRRSLYGPAVAFHPKEQGRLEFKAFDMPAERHDFHAFFLLWLWLVADATLTEKAEDQDRVYDLAAVARFGWQADSLSERAEEILERAGATVANFGFDPAPLENLRRQLAKRWLPAFPLIRQMEKVPAVPELLRFIDRLASGMAEPALMPVSD